MRAREGIKPANRAALAALIYCCAGTAALAKSDAASCLRFDEAIALSVDRAPSVAVAKAEAAEAAADLKDARSLYRPKLSAFGRTGLGDVGADNSVVQNQAGFRVSQRLYDFGDARLARAAARLNEQSRIFGVEQSRLAAATETARTILDRLEAEEQLSATSERRAYFDQLLRSIETLLLRGGATRGDVADVAARLAEADALALELQLFIETADTAIALDTGREEKPCKSSVAAAYLDLHAATLVLADDASALALAASPALRAIEARAKSAEQARRREARGRLPTIEAVAIGAYASTQDSGDFELQNRVGVDLSIPLYSGAALSARNDRAAARAALANAEAARARLEIEENARTAFARRNSLRDQLKSRQTVEDRKREALVAAEIEHRNGLRTLPDLIEARLDYEDAAVARIQANFELLRQQMELLSITALLPLPETVQ